ncbi:MAG: site-specific integrase [Solirubrobacterales bacterium]
MRAFGGERLSEISTQEVRRFLSNLDHEEMSAGTVNKHRQLLHALFEFAKSSDTFDLKENPVSPTARRPESGTAPLDVFEPTEVELIAEAAREGLHRKRSDHDYSADTRAEQRRMDEQDGDLFVIAAFTGLRLGELLALQWHDLDLGAGLLTVTRAVSAGVEVDSTKSRQFRTVPLAEQAVAAFKRLSSRKHFTGRADYVFCRVDGGPLDRTTVRKRFVAAQDAAGVRRRRFHDLRHSFGSLAVRHFDAIQVQALLGHSSLQTTERYLHTRPRADDSAKLTKAFTSSETGEGERADS